MGIHERLSLDGKRALITGGSKGLGFAMAKAFAEAGADLVLIGRDLQNLVDAKEELGSAGTEIEVISADLSSPQAAEAMCHEALARHAPIHILVNNVGGREQNVAFFDQSVDNWSRLLDLNVTAAFVCMRILGKPMVQRKWGRVINVGSMSSEVVTKGIEGRHYETGKAALVGLTRAIAADWAPHNVTVNIIAPGPFMTDANRRWFEATPGLRSNIEQNIPMQRIAEPDEIGGLAVFLASEASSYVTGASILIDGGYTLW